jgi:hypothetical protein
VAITTAGVQRVNFNGATEVVFNDGGADVDFRIEGDTEPNLFKIDAGTDQVQVANLNGGPLAGFRNAIINGNFDIWQRGTTFTGNTYGADRWIHGRLGTTHTASRQSFALGQTNVPNEPTYFCRTVVSSVAASGNFSALIQRIEGVRSFAGQQVTVSFWAKANASKSISVDFLQYFGTGGSPSADVSAIGATKIAIGTTWQKITVTASIPSISGKTIGTNNNDALDFYIWFDASSVDNARTVSLGHQSGTFDIAQVQIERGPVATPFERRSYGQELSLCQRYFQQLGGGMVGFEESNTTHSYGIRFNQPMRAAPTFDLISSSFAYRYINASGVGDRTITVSINGATVISTQAAWLYLNDVSTGSVIGRGAIERNGGNYINASAEL